MPRTTLNDRQRKARIREREDLALYIQLQKIENITPEQIKLLRKIEKAQSSEKPLQADKIAELPALREMGVVRESEGGVLVSALGREVLEANKDVR